METKEIKLPNGYTVTLKTSLSYRNYLAYQQIIASGSSFDIVTQKPKGEIALEKVYEANEKAIQMLVVKVVDKLGSELPNPFDTIMDLPVENLAEVMEEVTKITTRAQEAQKKGT